MSYLCFLVWPWTWPVTLQSSSWIRLTVVTTLFCLLVSNARRLYLIDKVITHLVLWLPFAPGLSGEIAPFSVHPNKAILLIYIYIYIPVKNFKRIVLYLRVTFSLNWGRQWTSNLRMSACVIAISQNYCQISRKLCWMAKYNGKGEWRSGVCSFLHSSAGCHVRLQITERRECHVLLHC